MYKWKKECIYAISYGLLPLPPPLLLLLLQRFVTDDLRERLFKFNNNTPVVGYVFGGGIGSGDGFRFVFWYGDDDLRNLARRASITLSWSNGCAGGTDAGGEEADFLFMFKSSRLITLS